MPTYKADLHIHTLLSPCGDLDMTPEYIVETALRNGIDIIGITDHNSTRHCQLTEFYSKNRNIFVLCGAEVTTKEEAHCLAFFPNHERLAQFQQLLEKHLPDIPNDPDFFGDQIQIDEEMNIIYEEPRLLTSALDLSIEQIEREVHALDGMFIPAHIDKSKTSVISQLGFIPFDLEYEAVEITKHTTKEAMIQQHKYLKNKPFIRSSDAHQPDQIGTNTTQLTMPTRNFEEIKKAILALAND
ncbi:MAG TPA: PHP domain-containing protein [Bacteroidales bacterium]|jgi:PHP family Zn ribbon phosphoesterase|nr:PHP domain-containing protein [Bacteroidales bacterium]HOH23106.1 PHP domain-containing protein [Bacteroidales bacterium]HPB58260.1 PHP domain-containing protein [Bacteroidales bacterium]HPZ04321.1 PHP domain-containing protein [Bacteroidales bacterium]HQB75784.1 PHP domain-containing protein [Bacteroidales bacterium]